jgi:hypothetical protein
MPGNPAYCRKGEAFTVSVAEAIEFLGFQKKEDDTYELLRGRHKLIIQHNGPGPITHPRRPIRGEIQPLNKRGSKRFFKYQTLRKMVIHEMPERLEGFDKLIPPAPESPTKPAGPIFRRADAAEKKEAAPPEYRAWVIDTWKAVIRAVDALPNR